MNNKIIWSLFAGIIGGFVGNGVLGVLFTSTPVHDMLYNPALQSDVFLNITPLRHVPVSVAGLVFLSAIHGWLFCQFYPSLLGFSWMQKGLFWGFVIWAMFWLFQEWFVYHTLLNEPFVLNLLELFILLLGSLVEGLVISFILVKWRKIIS